MAANRECNHPTCNDKCRREKKVKRRKPLKRFSKKRTRDNRSYSVLRKQFLESNPECQARLKMCRGEATDVHHKAGRVGDKLLDTDYWLACCRPCHVFIESHPVAAKEMGFSESRLIK